MKPTTRKLILSIFGICALGSVSLRGTPVTVQELGIGASKVVNISSSTLGTFNAYAGVIDLLINGVPTEGFCIDPFHFSVGGPQPYNSIPLQNGPKPPGPMGVAAAQKVEQLWQKYYTPSIDSATAAGLQIAIWEIVDAAIPSASFSINGYDYGASTFIAWVNANPGAPAANLVALTGPGQDYVIPSVPESATTVILLGVTFLGLAGFRRLFSIS